MAISARAMCRTFAQAGGTALAFVSVLALGICILSAALWTFDAGEIPTYALVWLIFWLIAGSVAGLLSFFLRRVIGRTGIHIAITAAMGTLVGLSLPLALTYRNSCSAIGWHYDESADLLFPNVVWTEPLNCGRSSRYQQFAGIWTYGEWGSTFEPTGPKSSLRVGRLRIDEAAVNLVIDTMLHQQVSRYEGRRIHITFRGNMFMQGRHDVANSQPIYVVRDIVAARLIDP